MNKEDFDRIFIAAFEEVEKNPQETELPDYRESWNKTSAFNPYYQKIIELPSQVVYFFFDNKD